ncbi:(2Fe-2S)-binding protein [Futiania mangrovi]|uniref:(2Fe-2S)-binding protein n=1 Tax=Futiania mangrovi TaxID=2959716 RepID=A0A9J6PJ42_9PROT|nr:(2Fe-2S)-binding protein [Futiania mangrovii]MCP1337803.1 (2Fe-2S)-binding protein [Futiania mangrovii]
MKRSSEQPQVADLRVRRGFVRGAHVTFIVDGAEMEAPEGESLAVALFVNGRRTLRRSPRDANPRGMFCLMGSCQECVVTVDGRRVPSCMEPVRAGMVVVTGDPG